MMSVPDVSAAQNASECHYWMSLPHRIPLDWIEQTTTGCADLVLVNSAFTRGVFKDTFSRQGSMHVRASVLSPAWRPTAVVLCGARTNSVVASTCACAHVRPSALLPGLACMCTGNSRHMVPLCPRTSLRASLRNCCCI